MEIKKKHTILIIDPNAAEVDNLSCRLSSVGFNVLCAENEEIAFKLIEVGKADIILLDPLISKECSSDMLTTIRGSGESCSTPVIILSSDIDVNSKVYGFLAGANDYMVRPFRFVEILARINTQLRILSMQKELEEKNKELVEKNVLLQQMAVTDALTKLYNRSYMITRLSSEIAHCSRYKEAISFIMADIDHFKRINDTYGHSAGDNVLKTVAKRIVAAIRDVDIVIRYGGEEFLIVCPNTDLAGAKVVSERIRHNVESAMFKVGTEQTHVTLSLGIRSLTPDSRDNQPIEINNLIGDADVALYRAKSGGRNRVEVYDSQFSVSQSNNDDEETGPCGGNISSDMNENFMQ